MSEIRTDTINNASGDNDSGIDLSTNDQVSIKTANTTAVTVDASQNVILSSNEPTLFLKDSNNVNTTRFIKNNAEIFTIGRINDDLSSSNVEHLRVDDSGRMLLNTTTHTNGRLNVTESLNIQPCLGLRSSYASNTGNFVLFTSDNGTGAGAISHINASTVAYNTSSDYRLKQNVTYDFDATTRLKQLQPARFSWNHDDTNTLVDGFLAHEVQEVVPEAITGTKDAVDVWKDGEELPEGISVGDNKLDENGNTIPVYQQIDPSKLVPLLVKTIQELEARITALENA